MVSNKTVLTTTAKSGRRDQDPRPYKDPRCDSAIRLAGGGEDVQAPQDPGHALTASAGALGNPLRCWVDCFSERETAHLREVSRIFRMWLHDVFSIQAQNGLCARSMSTKRAVSPVSPDIEVFQRKGPSERAYRVSPHGPRSSLSACWPSL